MVILKFICNLSTTWCMFIKVECYMRRLQICPFTIPCLFQSNQWNCIKTGMDKVDFSNKNVRHHNMHAFLYSAFLQCLVLPPLSSFHMNIVYTYIHILCSVFPPSFTQDSDKYIYITKQYNLLYVSAILPPSRRVSFNTKEFLICRNISTSVVHKNT